MQESSSVFVTFAEQSIEWMNAIKTQSLTQDFFYRILHETILFNIIWLN